MDKVWRLSPEEELKSFQRAFPKEGLTKQIESFVGHSTYKVIRAARNQPMHRGSPGRNYFCGGPNDGKELWVVEDESGPIELDAASPLLVESREWLAMALRGLLEATLSFAESHLPHKP